MCDPCVPRGTQGQSRRWTRITIDKVHCAHGHGAGQAERANFMRVLWFLVQRAAFVWVYEPDGVSTSVAWRLGVYDGRCLGALCWDVVSCHVRPGCMSVSFLELPPQSAPWLRSTVGAPKAKGRAKKANRAARFQSGDTLGVVVSAAASSSGAVVAT